VTDNQGPPEGPDFQSPYTELEDLTGAEPLPALEDPAQPAATPPRSPLLTGLIVGLLLVVGSIAVFQLLGGGDDETAGGATTTTPESTTTTTVTAAAGSTPTTDASATETTAAVVADFDPYVASGDPVPIDQLTLAVDGVGPILFGTAAPDAIGRLITSLGDPDQDDGPVVSTGAFGTCQGDIERIVRWGPFVAIVTVDANGTETFAGYRLDFSYGDISSPATDLATVSGVTVGASVTRLEQVYEAFDLRYEVTAELGDTFQVYSRNSGDLLLWGPVTSSEDGFVVGIYAPDACNRA
jgi:hypothetical protein